MQKVLLLVTILLVSTSSLKFVIDLSGGEKQCFYEVLGTLQYMNRYTTEILY